jgi:hypothetical protein
MRSSGVRINYPLLEAVERGDVLVASLLLRAGAKLDVQATEARPPTECGTVAIVHSL